MWASAYVRAIVVIGVAVITLIALEALLLIGIGNPGPLQWFLLGAFSALFVSIPVAGLGLSFLVSDPIAIHQVRGAWGKDNTRDELRKSRRRGHVWGWVDSVTLAAGDIDHLVVTKAGGIVAIDSKWRTRVNPAGRDEMVRDAAASRRRAEGVIRTVLERDRPGRRAARAPLRVQPLVVLWGSAQSTLPEGTVIDGVEFVRGRDLSRWIEAIDGEPVEQGPGEDLLERLEQFRAKTWERLQEPFSR